MEEARQPENPYLEIYSLYHSEYWFYKLGMLANILAGFDELEQSITRKIERYDRDLFQRLIKLEVHFAYFQVVEALFSILFAIKDTRDEFLWPELTFGNWTDHSKRISEILDEKKTLLNTDIELSNGDKRPFLEWALFHLYEPIPEQQQREDHLNFVKNILQVFAKDWADRADYNAYKHSLRLFHNPHELRIGISRQGEEKQISLGKVDDATMYLEKILDKQLGKKRINKTSKPFSPIRDYRLAMIGSRIISNIFTVRRKYYLKMDGTYYNFENIQFEEAIKTGLKLGKSSFTVD